MAQPTKLKLALVIALTIAASPAYATTRFSGATSVSGSSFSSSNKVSVYAASDATGSMYVINSAHDLGDKCIGAQAGDSKLYYTTAAAGSASTIACTVVTTSTITGWTSM